MDWERLIDTLQMSRDRIARLAHALVRAGLVLALSYVAAQTVSAYCMSGMMTQAVTAFNRMAGHQVRSASVSFAATENYRDIEKAVRDRNLFNSTGEFPDETDPSARDEQHASSFDMNAACSKSTLNIALVGTIYMGEQATDSIATVQESGYSEADVYRVGDQIIGNEQASVAKIERNRVILNNNGVKECLELASNTKSKAAGSDFPSPSSSAAPPPADGQEPPAAGGHECNLDEKYVQDELGPGFGTIIQKARLVPNTTDNQMNGFKIFAIEKASLLGKTGLMNGDVITQVNEVSLKQPEQGFALYQAFQDEKEVRIHILRNGTTPMMITCRIR